MIANTPMSLVSQHMAERVPTALAGVELVAMASDRVFPRHAHDQFCIGLMRSGGHRSWSAVGDVEAVPGDVIAVSPGEIHDGAPLGRARAWQMINVEPSVVAQLVGNSVAGREFGFGVRRDRSLARLLERTLVLLGHGDDPSAIDQALTLLLSDSLDEKRADETRGVSSDVLRLCERIHDEPAAPPSLDEAACLMGMERTSALRRFRRETGATPHEYAMQYRLRRARQALILGVAPADVAVDLGFADQSHLSRAFARQFGLPPGRFRAR